MTRARLDLNQKLKLIEWLRKQEKALKKNPQPKTTVAAKATSELGYLITERVIENITDTIGLNIFPIKHSPFQSVSDKLKDLEQRVLALETITKSETASIISSYDLSTRKPIRTRRLKTY